MGQQRNPVSPGCVAARWIAEARAESAKTGKPCKPKKPPPPCKILVLAPAIVVVRCRPPPLPLARSRAAACQLRQHHSEPSCAGVVVLVSSCWYQANWNSEFAKWLSHDAMRLLRPRVLDSGTHKTIQSRVDELSKWTKSVPCPLTADICSAPRVARPRAPLRLTAHARAQPRVAHPLFWFLLARRHGGVLVMGYEMFRLLLQGQRMKPKIQAKLNRHLAAPGPNVIVLDEGHRIRKVPPSCV